MNKYEIFRKCFPKIDVSEKIFYKLVNVENVYSIEYKQGGQLVAFAFIEKNALRLLCVLPKYQNKGIGTMLLKQSEKYIKEQGYEEMKRSMQDFSVDNYALSIPENTSFGWYQGSIKELGKAVADVEEDWVKYFDENSNVFCGWRNNEISSFCIVHYDSECILSNGNNKVGTIGCVGTVHKYREQGIGLKMVALASEELKKQNCDLCFIHFTGVAECFIENMKGESFMANILQRDGLTVELLKKLSYKSELGINLKKNLHYFDKESILTELVKINEWYDEFQELYELALDYRIKSIQSAMLKYDRYYPDHQVRKVFDDLLGFRSLCDNYDDVLALSEIAELRVADMSKGKANDDGYRGVHVYFQLSGSHYPIEI